MWGVDVKGHLWFFGFFPVFRTQSEFLPVKFANTLHFLGLSVSG